MKKVLLFILLIVSIVSYGNNEIILQKGIRIYCINNPTINLQIKQYVTYGAITETVNKNKKWYIVKFINVGEKLEKYYNAIIISKTQNIKNKVYAVMYEDLGYYKYLIDDANNKIKEKYNCLDSIKQDYIRDTTLNNLKYINVCYDVKKIYKDMNTILKDSIEYNYSKQKEILYNKLSQKAKSLVNRINITDCKLVKSNNLGGYNILFEYLNIYYKTIKYLYFETDFYNGVDDKIPCDIKGFNFKKCKDTGFIYQYETGGGVFDNVIYNKSTSYMIIKSIKIIYNDNTVYSISLTKYEYIKLIKYFNFVNSIDENVKSIISDAGFDKRLNNDLKELKKVNSQHNLEALEKYNNSVKKLFGTQIDIDDVDKISLEYNIKESIVYIKKIKKPEKNLYQYWLYNRYIH